MKKVFKTSIFLLLISISLFSNSQIVSVNPDNISNPFDYLGKDHNEGLDYFIAHNPTPTMESFTENWENNITEFLSTKDYNVSDFISIIHNEQVVTQCGVMNFYQSTSSVQELRELHDKSLVNDIRFEKVTLIYDYINEIDTNLINHSGDASIVYSIFKNKMLNLESELSSLNESDKNFCLIVSAIARYSVFYWLNQATMPVSSWHVPNCSTTGFKFSWGILGASDVGGAVAGATRFGVAALFGGPATWGACGIASLGTGLGASAGYGVASLISHWLGH